MDKRIHCRAVRRLLLATAVLIAGPAQAVDYVQCREMLRTRADLINEAAELQSTWWATITKPNCDHLKSEGFEVIGNCYTKTVDEYVRENSKYAVSIREFGATPTNLRYGLLFAPDAKKVGIAAWKVHKDMIKGGCPIR